MQAETQSHIAKAGLELAVQQGCFFLPPQMLGLQVQTTPHSWEKN